MGVVCVERDEKELGRPQSSSRTEEARTKEELGTRRNKIERERDGNSPPKVGAEL